MSIIPVRVRGAEWASVTDELPQELRPLQKLNAIAPDHGTWAADLEPLMKLLERMLGDPARAPVICRPPEPRAVETALTWKSIRSALVHAADLAECLDDPSVLTDAREAVPAYLRGWEGSRRTQDVPRDLDLASHWDYVILKRFSSYEDMPSTLHGHDHPRVSEMLRSFEASIRTPGLPE